MAFSILFKENKILEQCKVKIPLTLKQVQGCQRYAFFPLFSSSYFIYLFFLENYGFGRTNMNVFEEKYGAGAYFQHMHSSSLSKLQIIMEGSLTLEETPLLCGGLLVILKTLQNFPTQRNAIGFMLPVRGAPILRILLRSLPGQVSR